MTLTPRGRLVLLLTVLLSAAGLVGLAAWRGEDDEPARELAPGRGSGEDVADPLTWRPERQEDFEARAARGVSHVLYEKSPGGAVATAQRVARFRKLVEEVAGRHELDADVLEAMVFLESAGRPDARASDDLQGAVGLTQILAETGQNLLRMRIDVAASERLTRGIDRGSKVAARRAARRRVDERFDPRKALEATARYLTFAKRQLGRDDLAVASYHSGVGNLQRALRAYGEQDIPYAQLYFDSTPLRHEEAHAVLASLGDDSSTYLWRVYAAREMLRVWRHEPAELAALAALHARQGSAEEVLHPRDATPAFSGPDALDAALGDGALVALDPQRLRCAGLRVGSRVGAGSDRPARYRALRPEALALLLYLGAGVREIAGDEAVLRVTGAARDTRYAPRGTHGVAPGAFDLHATGWSFDIARDYASRKQALAFQFWLDRLQALNLIAWVREPAAIHVTVSERASRLASVLRP